MQKNGVTLLELLIVIIIVAILAAVGVPVYTYRIERTKGERAIANIELIKDALRMYYVKYEAEPDYSITTSLSNINTILGLSLNANDTSFSYNMSDQTTFRRIQATRSDGIFNTNTITYNINVVNGTLANWDSANSNWPWIP